MREILIRSLPLLILFPTALMGVELGNLKSRLPAQTSGLLFFKTDESSIKTIANLIPGSSESVMKILKDQANEFEKNTGVNPLNADYVVVASSLEPGRTPIILVHIPFDAKKIIEVVQKTPALAEKIKAKETTYGLIMTMQERYACFTRDNFIIIGEKDEFKEVVGRKGEAAPINPVIENNLDLDSRDNVFCLRMVIPQSMRDKWASGANQGPFSPAILSHMTSVILQTRDGAMNFSVLFDEAGAAEAAKNVVDGLIQTGQSQAEAQVAGARDRAKEFGPLAPLDPGLVGALIGQETSRSMLAAMKPEIKGTELAFAFDVRGFSQSGFGAVMLAGVLAAVAMPQLQAAQAAGDPAAVCFENQKAIGAALEMYAMDKKVPIGTLAAKVGQPEFFQELVTAQYLTEVPVDPGAAEGSAANYTATGEGELIKVTCSMHGSHEDAPGAVGEAPPIAPDLPPDGVLPEGTGDN